MTEGNLLHCWAPYKVSLAGEHAVGYGGSSIVAALDVGLTLSIRRASARRGTFRCGRRIARWTRRDVTALAEAVDHRFATVGATAWRRWRRDWFAPSRYVVGSWSKGTELPEFDAISQDDGWSGAGLGTSSSSAAALSRVCAELARREQTITALKAEIRRAERLRHAGIPSGVDGEVVVQGGVLSFGAGRVLEAFPVPAVEMVLVHSRVARDCNEVIARFARRSARQIATFVMEMETLTGRVAESLRRGDSAALCAALEDHYPLMRRHGLGDRRVTGLLRALRRHGARAAKLTGAGCGGVVVAFCPPGGAASVRRFCASRRLRALSCTVSRSGCGIVPDDREGSASR
jgi:mevalonate kinase